MDELRIAVVTPGEDMDNLLSVLLVKDGFPSLIQRRQCEGGHSGGEPRAS